MSESDAPGELGLVQRLVNTLDVETGEDRLTAPGGVARFADANGVELPGVTASQLGELREALRAVLLCHAGAEPPPGGLADLTRMLREAPLVVRPAPDGRVELVPAPGVRGVAALTARVAAAVAVGEVSGQWRRLKACHATECAWAYYDRSPAGRRRWCSMSVCGSRAKMRSYRDRRRAAGE
ncbi:CGNR zinc finger domain-containing protein [Streptomyces bohaiensis]|uniref:CGNR zinc finger domain-containing protein n=1 Tax=Streptomyces bohaiensis TaxID=1431344 RepID=A0ABX1CD67_9ACTN|nr:CGNR zinc finger domain-containing protein [Streptomyces bohaiensis]NJQ14254.1 CGNR zinc finger domain-containing protein [Streptomyces bohaiensis]